MCLCTYNTDIFFIEWWGKENSDICGERKAGIYNS